jgi:hypothetical protein
MPRSNVTMKPRKGCWTCAGWCSNKIRTILAHRPPARKVQCDGGLPCCQKCSRAGRECQGYEMRLSWPRNDDKKRAIIVGSPQMIHVRRETNPFFVNTTWRDIELHNRQSLRGESLPAPAPFTDLWRPSNHMDLLHHCKFERTFRQSVSQMI